MSALQAWTDLSILTGFPRTSEYRQGGLRLFYALLFLLEDPFFLLYRQAKCHNDGTIMLYSLGRPPKKGGCYEV